jgi:hypothetical protein
MIDEPQREAEFKSTRKIVSGIRRLDSGGSGAAETGAIK